MPIMFNTILREAGLSPSDVRLLRHQDNGGNVALKSREPSDYQISILEVAGTSATHEDILAMEGRWQHKLQSNEMGLNRNLARPA